MKIVLVISQSKNFNLYQMSILTYRKHSDIMVIISTALKTYCFPKIALEMYNWLIDTIQLGTIINN